MAKSESLRLPNYDMVRHRIEAVPERNLRLCLMTTYLYAGRISEVIGMKHLSNHTTTPRGPRGTDAVLDSYKQEPVVVFHVSTAKRGGYERRIGLPLNFEPWAKPVYDYFQERGNEVVFPFTRQVMWAVSKEVFQGLSYPIDDYKVLRDGKLHTVKRHPKSFRLHAIRHLRASELVEYYGFDGFNLATYGGWKYSTSARTSGVMDRYLTLGWQSYIEKLLKPRR